MTVEHTAPPQIGSEQDLDTSLQAYSQEPDEIFVNKKDLLGHDKGTARTWPDIALQLPPEFFEDEKFSHVRRFVVAYSGVQRKLAERNPTKAQRKFDGLRRQVGFEEFEELNEPLFAAIEVAFRGETNRVDELGYPIEPSFKKIKLK